MSLIIKKNRYSEEKNNEQVQRIKFFFVIEFNVSG